MSGTDRSGVAARKKAQVWRVPRPEQELARATGERGEEDR
jgi:hypothetical protein